MKRVRLPTGSNRLNVYIRDELIARLNEEAKRLDRPVSWVVQYCIKQSLEKVGTLPSHDQQLKSQQEE